MYDDGDSGMRVKSQAEMLAPLLFGHSVVTLLAWSTVQTGGVIAYLPSRVIHCSNVAAGMRHAQVRIQAPSPLSSAALAKYLLAGVAGYVKSRGSRYMAMSCRVSPRSVKSAMISPTTLQNLKPWPEHGEAMHTCGKSGC